MPTPPPHIEIWDSIPRDLENNDRSRFRGDTPAELRDTAEIVTNLGNGLTGTTYVDTIGPPATPAE